MTIRRKELLISLAGTVRTWLTRCSLGLGKTVQAVVAAREADPEKPLVVAPASTLPNWRREIHKWWPDARVPVISYARLIQRRFQHRLKQYAPDLVILDEAHYCKTPSAKRTKAALGLARGAGTAWLLSGTPMPNDPTELWAPIKYLWPEIAARHKCKTAADWRNRFTVWSSTKYGPRVHSVRDAETLKAELRTFMLRRRTADVLPDLPPLRVNVEILEKDVKDWDEMVLKLQEAGVDYRGIKSLEDIPDYAPEHIATLRRFLGAYKAPRIVRQLKAELADGAYEKIVVLAHHRDVIDLIRQGLGDYDTVVVTGSTPEGTRQRMIDWFNDGDAQVFLGQQTAAGVGINLQAAHEIVLMEPAWSPEDNQQSIKRVHRIGQDTPVRARLFAVEGTLDEALMTRLAEKTAMIQEILER